MERTVCSNPKLSAMDDRLGERFSSALALSPDPAPLRDEQRQWIEKEKTNSDPGRLATVYFMQIGYFDRLLARLKAVKRVFTEKDARTLCPSMPDESADAACKVTGFGTLPPLEGHTYVYSLLKYTSNGDVLGTGAAVFERMSSGLKLLFLPDYDGAIFFDAPKILRSDGRTVLCIYGSESGTGNFNRERLFAWRDSRWRDVDTTSWLDALQRRLPKGLDVRKGIYPDYTRMTAQTDLWRKDDGEACGTGGQADLRLKWSGDRIVLDALTFHPDRRDC
ncbi:MAG TPA: hypothetical protein VGL35_09100 [Rhizomicrobium sp.]